MTYERPRALVRCLESLARLDPPTGGFEVVVVDDGSSEDPRPRVEAFARRLRIRCERAPHRGISAARNRGLRLARGAFVAFLADDYVLPRDYLLHAERLFRREPEAVFVTFNMRSCGTGFGRLVQDLYFRLVLLGNAGAEADACGVIRTSTLPASRAAVFRREVFERVGPFDETMTGGEDGELAERMAKHGISQHFLTKAFVEHWEEKSFLEFLRQRRAYATSFYELWRRQQPPDSVARRWTLAACVGEITTRMRRWWQLSRRDGSRIRFLVLAPGLMIFLGTYFLTLHRRERASR